MLSGFRAAAPVRVSQLDLEQLSPVAAAQGLEGQVLRCLNSPYLCKVFAVPKDGIDAAALQQLIDFREWNADRDDRELIRSLFSWPVHRVLDDATLVTVGVLIPAAEPRFYFEHEGELRLREGQHLPRPTSVAGTFDLDLRIRVLSDLGRAWDLLDRNQLVYGDANSRNLVFASAGTPAAFVLDCDGIRPAGHPRQGMRMHPNWGDPYADGGIQSDRYQYALWVLRALSSSMLAPPGTGGADFSALPPRASKKSLISLLARGLGSPGNRPAPQEYLPVLAAL